MPTLRIVSSVPPDDLARAARPPPLPPPPPPPPLAVYRPYNTWAIVSLSFAASTILGSWFFGGLVAVITGHVARHQIKRTGEQGMWMSTVGIILGAVHVALIALIVIVLVGAVFFLGSWALLHH
jgi:hypothetical protein